MQHQHISIYKHVYVYICICRRIHYWFSFLRVLQQALLHFICPVIDSSRQQIVSVSAFPAALAHSANPFCSILFWALSTAFLIGIQLAVRELMWVENATTAAALGCTWKTQSSTRFTCFSISSAERNSSFCGVFLFLFCRNFFDNMANVIQHNCSLEACSRHTYIYFFYFSSPHHTVDCLLIFCAWHLHLAFFNDFFFFVDLSHVVTSLSEMLAKCCKNFFKWLEVLEEIW